MKREATLDEVKRIQISVLDEVDLFCKNNGIRYFLIAGTLLGAVRHKGFIPWDDDIDICMLRKEYERFVSLYEGKTTEIMTSEKNGDYYYPFAKVVKRSTLTEEECDYSSTLGINIDVFQIDNIPDGEKARRKYYRNISRYRKLLSRKVFWKTKHLFKKVLLLPYFLFHGSISKKQSINKMNVVASQYKDEMTQLRGCTIWNDDMRGIVNSECFDDAVYLEFEHKKYPCPIGYKEWLSSKYGDYMKLPPESERASTHKRRDFLLDDKGI